MVGRADIVPVGPVDVVPILPPQGSEKTPDDLTRFFLECLMDNMVTQVGHLISGQVTERQKVRFD